MICDKTQEESTTSNFPPGMGVPPMLGADSERESLDCVSFPSPMPLTWAGRSCHGEDPFRAASIRSTGTCRRRLGTSAHFCRRMAESSAVASMSTRCTSSTRSQRNRRSRSLQLPAPSAKAASVAIRAAGGRVVEDAGGSAVRSARDVIGTVPTARACCGSVPRCES